MDVAYFRGGMRPDIFLKLLVGTLCFAAPLQLCAQSGYPNKPGTRGIAKTTNTNSDPESAESTSALLKKAGKAHDSGQWDTAELLYQNVLIRDSSNLAAMLELADIYEHMNKLEYARGLLLRASAIDPTNESLLEKSFNITRRLSLSLHHEIDSLIAGSYHGSAIPRLSILQTLEPENPDLYYKKALCHFQIDNLETALLEITKALRLQNDRTFHDLHVEIRSRIKEQKLFKLIERAAEAVNTRSPDERESAMTLLGKVLELDPDNEWARREFMRLSGGGGESDFSGPAPGALSIDRLKPLLNRIRGTGAGMGVYLGLLAEFLARYLTALFALLILLLLVNSPLTRSIIEGIPPKHILSGDLSRFSIYEILMLINSQTRSGTLVIKSSSIKGEVFFEKGEPCHCKAGSMRGKDALKIIIKTAKDGSFYFRKIPSSVEKTIDTPLSLLLMDLPDRKLLPNTTKRPPKTRSKIASLLDGSS